MGPMGFPPTVSRRDLSSHPDSDLTPETGLSCLLARSWAKSPDAHEDRTRKAGPEGTSRPPCPTRICPARPARISCPPLGSLPITGSLFYMD
jgi:hypothetical protein